MNKIILLICLSFIISVSINASDDLMDIELTYGGFYESNLYHSYADSLEAGSMLNNLKVDVSKNFKQSKQWNHKFTVFTDLDLYPNYSNRNKTSFGIVYEPDRKSVV